MKIVLIRHLCTPGNEKKQYIGRTDESLSENAVEAFQRSRNSYPAVQTVIASPMKRCIETARLIYPQADICIEPMLRECDFGKYEQKTYEDLKDEPEYIRWMESGGMTAFPGGEDQTAFRGRCVDCVKKWISRLLSEETDSAAFIVHGGTIMAVLSELSEDVYEFYHWQVENGGGYVAEVTAEDWENGRKILRKVKRL